MITMVSELGSDMSRIWVIIDVIIDGLLFDALHKRYPWRQLFINNKQSAVRLKAEKLALVYNVQLRYEYMNPAVHKNNAI